MFHLTLEIWTRVASFAPRTDLMNLSRVSSKHLAAARHIFCKKLSIRDDPERILKYILQYNMTSTVKEIVIYGNALYGDNDEMDLKIIVACPNLRSLTMIVTCHESFLESSKAQKQFVKKLRTSCVRLQEFRLTCGGHLRGGDFSIPNLKTIKWKEHGKISRSLLSLSKASASTLADISLGIHDGIFSEFFQLQFPVLVKFCVGPGHERFGEEPKHTTALASALTKFLMAHPTITTLNLVYSPSTYLPDSIYVPLARRIISPDILPRLEVLEAHPKQVSDFISANARFFKDLKSLRFSRQHDKPEQFYLNELFSEFTRYSTINGPSNLMELTCKPIYHTLSSEDFNVFIQKVAAVFPQLETWEGNTPKPFDGFMLANAFACFSRLREIIYNGGKVPLRPQDIHILASSFPLLEIVECCVGSTVFKISRIERESADVTTINAVPSIERESQQDYHEDSDLDDCPDSDEYNSSGNEDVDDGDE